MNAILAGFRAKRDAHLSAVRQGQERETVYLDVDEEGGGDRSSVWSDAHSRYSFLDGEKSAEIREKFVRRVEAMYGKEIVPPVPKLGAALGGAR